jgi:HD-like signal output (HDOD) protein
MYQWLQRLFSGQGRARPVKTPTTTAQTDARGQATPAPPPPGTAGGEPAAPTPSPSAGAGQGAVAEEIPVPAFDQREQVDAGYYDWLFDSQGAGDLDMTPAEQQVMDALAGILASQQSGAALVRRLPGVIPQLLQSLRSDNFSVAQLSRTLSNDLVLVAAVIRTANSSLVGSATQINSVEHAVMVIGQEGLRQLITSVAFRPILDMHSGPYTRALAPRIWDQSERCALASRQLAEAYGSEPFEAFLAGLIQNVGLIVTLRVMDQADKDGKHLGSQLFCAALVRDARTLSVSIAREWNFPAGVVQAIADQGGMRKGVQLSRGGRLLMLADYLSKVRILTDHERLGRSDPMLFRGLPPLAQACCQVLEGHEDDYGQGTAS